MAEGGQEVSCEVCLEEYSTGERAPLFLPCGHTFCRRCLAVLKKERNFSCLVCRNPHVNVIVEQLPVNFALLKVSSSSSKKIKLDLCNAHGDDLKYWCSECTVALCGLCLSTSNHVGHKVFLAKDFLQDKKTELSNRVQVVKEDIKKQKKRVWDNWRKQQEQMCSNWNKLCCANCYDLHQLDTTDADLTSLLTNVKGISTVGEVPLYQARLENHEERRLFWASDTEDETAAAVAVPATPAAAGAVRRATLDCRDGRLLLLSLSNPAEGRLSVQLPSEVFLELSVGSRCLGRVYIRLWGHLRHARQMLVLCLGSLGASYTGASADKADDGTCEGLAFHHYIGDTKKHEVRGLISGVDSSSKRKKANKEGLVVGYGEDRDSYAGYRFGPYPMMISAREDYGYTPRHEGRLMMNEVSFIILTKFKQEHNSLYSFGEVTSGLEVARAAVSHSPVTEVTISSCGVVVPDLGDLTQYCPQSSSPR